MSPQLVSAAYFEDAAAATLQAMFTCAGQNNPGAIARTAKGTLFLDEIDKLSLKAQAGLQDRGRYGLG